jgi:quercetin dioxygenase-like cupin family protein
MEEHQSQAPVAILGLVGSFQLEVSQRVLEMGPQKAASLEAGVKHSIDASEDCAFLLTVGWSTEAAAAAEASHQRSRR